MTNESGVIVFIPLTQGKVAVVDFEDCGKVRGVKWCFNGRYAMRTLGNGGTQYMHRKLLPDGQVDHVNGDALDNRRANLRYCTASQNNANRRSPMRHLPRGVYLNDGASTYRARIRFGGAVIGLGSFGDAREAARAYDSAAVRLYGPFARLNFPEVAK